jgi:hypothetical protein
MSLSALVAFRNLSSTTTSAPEVLPDVLEKRVRLSIDRACCSWTIFSQRASRAFFWSAAAALSFSRSFAAAVVWASSS